jgi:shikimate kinase
LNAAPLATSARMGVGKAHGAVSILNATATGIGCALATEARTGATWKWEADPGFRLRPKPENDALGKAVHATVARHLGRDAPGASATVDCPTPPSRGLKTSSSVAAALIRAALDAAGEPGRDEVVESLAVEASRAACVTITGAFDDQVATVRGGCHVTDNRTQTVVASLRVQPWAVAVWVADAAIPKARILGVDASPARAQCQEAERLARSGKVPEAMTANGRAFTRLYAGLGLPIDGSPAEAALRAGALGAGLSGTGPSVAALFDRPTEIPAVPGGTWTWTRAVP